MFDATYREMKEYKENFLLEAHHKPVIHDLIRFYDSLKQVESQFDRILDGMEEIRPSDCLDSGRIWRTSASNWKRSCTAWT